MGSFPVGRLALAFVSGDRGSESRLKIRAEPSRAEPSRAEPSRAEPSRAEPSHSCVFTPGGFLRRLVRRGPDAVGRAAHRPRERHSRLSVPRRRAAGPASSSLSSRSPRRAARPAPALRAAAWLLAAALVLPAALLLSAGAAQAQSSVKLVSNTGQAQGGNASFISDYAQAFTTGGDSVGYRLTGVDLRRWAVAGATPIYTVTIRQDASGSPGSVVGTLTNPASVPLSASNVRYAAPGGGIDLDANKTYWVMIDVTQGSGISRIVGTSSDAEDTGAAAGWRIANTSLSRGFSTTTWGSPISSSFMLAIHGFARNPAPPGPPAAPTVSKTDGTSLTITWAAPPYDLAAQPVTDYDVRYRRKGDTAWTDHPHSGTALTTTINGLLQGASWEAQVAASNANGPGRWSATGAGHTGPARFVRAETCPNEVWICTYYTKDLQVGRLGTLTIRVDGTNRTSLPGTIIGGNEAAFRFSTAVQAGETVTLVSYTKHSSNPLRDADGLEIAAYTNKPVTNTVQATPPSAPAAPAAPTVSVSSSSSSILDVSWTAPAAGSSAITGLRAALLRGEFRPGRRGGLGALVRGERNSRLEHEHDDLGDDLGIAL